MKKINLDCVIYDDSINESFAIIQDGCMEDFVNTQTDSVNLTGQKSVGVSFTAFQFLGAQDKVSTLRISCSVSFKLTDRIINLNIILTAISLFLI